MYRFIIKMISHSSTEQNVCTHTHPHGHARKCCQITLVHTHGHTRGATLALTVQPGHAQAHLGTLYIRRAGSSSRAAAQRAHGAFQCSTHVRRKRRQRSCMDSDGRRPAAAAAAHSCRCPAAGASTGSRGSVLRTWGPAAAPSSIDRPQRTAPASANRAPMRVPTVETRRRGGSERGAHAPSRAQHARIVQDSRPPAGGSPLAPSVSCSWSHLDAAKSEKARVSEADWSCNTRTCDRYISGHAQINMLPLRAMHGATGGRARTFRWARAQSLAVPPTRRRPAPSDRRYSPATDRTQRA